MAYELFLSENMWLSLFFWQEYEIRYKPECFNLSRVKDSIIENPNLINDRLSGSFCSVNTSILSKNDPAHEYKEFRIRVKTYINIFKDHIFDPDHPINKVAKIFIRTFGNNIDDTLQELKKMRKSVSESFRNITEHRINQIIKQLQKFILKLQTCLRLMYSKTISYSCFIEEKDEFINLITNLIFRDEQFYEKIERAYKFLLTEKLSLLEKNFKLLKDINPEDLSLKEKFCLNELTRNYQQRLLQENKFKKDSESQRIR